MQDSEKGLEDITEFSSHISKFLFLAIIKTGIKAQHHKPTLYSDFKNKKILKF